MRVVSLVAHVPYSGIPHAGGQYALAHLRVLRGRGHEVTVIAPDWRGNGDNARLLREELGVDVIVCSPRASGRVADWWDTQQIRLFPVRPPRRFRRAVLDSPPAGSALSRAELIDAQWSEMGWLALHARTIRPGVRRVVTAHDVIAQTYDRVLARTVRGTPARLLGRWRRWSVARDEGRLYREMDAVVVFSEKDARYVSALSRDAARTVVLRPPFDGGVRASDPAPPDGPPTVLFVGAFFRDVNAQAAEWLIDEILPLVRAARPDVRFLLGGAGPTARMEEAAARDPLLEVTGEVPSLDPSYAEATVVVVPLRMGAGLKFKTVEAMMRGIPVVSTSVGAEGLVEEGETGGLTVQDDAPGMAAALLRVLEDPPAAWREAAAGREWARSVFSSETFPARLEDALLGDGVLR
ncbi:glycosyltransferase family 4 protein [Microbacterium sp. lyk4-40-TSB-66]|uniref:glycosyltransferase family 4 protein n=1 Tax=Microbacterium sp. lyk4-40-TSB-66 TaxID=3040294 RepID=UPI00254BAFA7|nr:glycosyltransferase family 4 protein [Microbacterium sp. lyk4-40-TSB-66]